MMAKEKQGNKVGISFSLGRVKRTSSNVLLNSSTSTTTKSTQISPRTVTTNNTTKIEKEKEQKEKEAEIKIQPKVFDIFAADSESDEEEKKATKKTRTSSVSAAVFPPEDAEVQRVADRLAEFVAKNGRSFEDLTRQKNPGDTIFGFLFDKRSPEYLYYNLKVSEYEEELKEAQLLSKQIKTEDENNKDDDSNIQGKDSNTTTSTSSIKVEDGIKKSIQKPEFSPIFFPTADFLQSTSNIPIIKKEEEIKYIPNLNVSHIPLPNPTETIYQTTSGFSIPSISIFASSMASNRFAESKKEKKPSRFSEIPPKVIEETSKMTEGKKLEKKSRFSEIPNGLIISDENPAAKARAAMAVGDSLTAMNAYMQMAAEKDHVCVSEGLEMFGLERDDFGQNIAAATATAFSTTANNALIDLNDFEKRKTSAIIRLDGTRGHHMQDFIPPEELIKFLQKCNNIPVEENDKNKITSDNIGHRLLSKMGWNEGEGLGATKAGLVQPVATGNVKSDNLGIGAVAVGEVCPEDDPYEQYRKRMMLGYKHRPNPLGNPRKNYY